MTALILTFLMLKTGSVGTLRSLTVRQWKMLTLVGLVGGSVPFVLFFTGLSMIPAATAALLHKTLFLWVALLAVPILGERLSGAQIAGYMLVLVSSLALGFKGLTWSTGEILVLCATLFWALEQIVAKVALRNIESTVLSWARMTIGTLVIGTYAASGGTLGNLLSVSPYHLLTIGGSSILLCGYVVTWYKALKLAPATLVSSILVLSVPITTILTSLETRALPTMQSFLSSSLVASGAFLIWYFGQQTQELKHKP